MRHIEFTFEIIVTIDPRCVFDELTYQLATSYTSIVRIAVYTHIYIHKDNTTIDSVASVTAL